MTTDHWNARTIDFTLPHLAQAQSQVRIATGFFTVQGYDLIRAALLGKHVYVLVGYDEESKEWLRQKLIDDVLEHVPEDHLLKMIQCRPETPVAEVDPNVIEELAQSCKGKWAHQQGKSPDDIERICALYLKPEQKPGGLEVMLLQATTP